MKKLLAMALLPGKTIFSAVIGTQVYVLKAKLNHQRGPAVKSKYPSPFTACAVTLK